MQMKREIKTWGIAKRIRLRVHIISQVSGLQKRFLDWASGGESA